MLELDAQPTRLIFGWGEARQLEEICSRSTRAVLFVTSRSFSGQADRLGDWSRSLEKRGIRATVRNEIQPNPDVDDILTVLPDARDSDIIIGVGGGSVLDTAKILAVLAAERDPAVLQTWLRGQRVQAGAPRKILVAVPTTSGTGSELSFGAILSSRAEGWKRGVRGEGIGPDIAIVDPQLAVSMSPRLTAATGFDVFTHAFESLVSKRATPQSRALSVMAIAAIGRSLPKALESPGDRQARTRVAVASAIMGLNLRDVGTCLPHRLQYAVAGVFPEVSHPETLASIYPAWIGRIFSVRPREVEVAFRMLGIEAPGSVSDAEQGIQNWLTKIGLSSLAPPETRGFGEVMVTRLEGDLSVDPISNPEAAAAAILREVF